MMRKHIHRKVIIAISCVGFIAVAVLAILFCLHSGANPYGQALRKSIEVWNSEVNLDEILEAELKGSAAGTALDWVKKFDLPYYFVPLRRLEECEKNIFFRKVGEKLFDSDPSSLPSVKSSLYYCVFGTTLSSGEKVYVYQFFHQFQNSRSDQYATNLYYTRPSSMGDSVSEPTLYSVKGLSYADFADIGPGSTMEDVMAIDPVAEIHRLEEETELKYRYSSWEYHNFDESYIEKFYTETFYKFHLVDEGILCIYYKHTKGEQIAPVVVGMKLYRDCMIGELSYAWAQEIGYCIDPADRPPRVDPPPTGEAPPDIVGEIE